MMLQDSHESATANPFAKFVAKVITVALVMLMAASVAVPALASPAAQQGNGMMAGTGPETALTPTGERETLAPNEKRWYTFRYVEGADGDDDDTPSEAVAELTMAYPDSIDFEVWTEDDVRMWANGEDFNPTGAGTPAFDDSAENNRDRSRLTWVGSGAATTTWYIIVENATNRAAPYTLTVTGPDVVFPETDTMVMEDDAAQNAATESDDASAEAASMDDAEMDDASDEPMDMMAGMGPASALTPSGMRHTLAPGETRWYTFRYVEGVDAGDSEMDDDEASEAVVEMTISRPNSIGFEVWTENDVRMWANGEDFNPTGVGSPAFAIEDSDSDNRDRRLLRWVGSGNATTTWYIIAENNSDAPASYRLTVTGPDVIFPENEGDSSASASTDSMQAPMRMAQNVEENMAAEEGMGTGPDNALNPTGMQTMLAPNEMRWYSFRYTGGVDDEDPEEVVAELRMAQPNAVSFEVWTEDDVRMWQNQEEFNPTGAGTPAFTIEDDPDADDRDRTLLRWASSGQATTTWYIIVENETDAPAPYRLTVTGQDVSF